MGNKIMEKGSKIFGFFVIFFIGVFSVTPIFINSIIIESKTFAVSYTTVEHHSCYITVTEPTIILRLDDVRAYSLPTPFIINEVLKRNLSITLGVIPKDLDKDAKMISYLSSLKNIPKIEIAQHGFFHNETDINITSEEMLKGNEIIQRYLGIKPISYIPPNNLISENSVDDISPYFSIITGEHDTFKEGKIARIGWNTETYDYFNNRSVSIITVVEQCKKAIEKTNLCVVAIHPQEYETVEKKQEFINLINNLTQLNTVFVNLKDVVFCK